jgi:hypothetical protein
MGVGATVISFTLDVGWEAALDVGVVGFTLVLLSGSKWLAAELSVEICLLEVSKTAL